MCLSCEFFLSVSIVHFTVSLSGCHWQILVSVHDSVICIIILAPLHVHLIQCSGDQVVGSMIIFILHSQTQKTVPNCDVSFTNGELHQTYGHVMLTMTAWPKYGHRSLVGCRLPRLCSYSWPPCICRLTPTTYQWPVTVFWSCTHH